MRLPFHTQERPRAAWEQAGSTIQDGGTEGADVPEETGREEHLATARANLERLAQHYAQLASFPDALWMTAMEGGAPTSDASAETAMLMKWLADNQDKL